MKVFLKNFRQFYSYPWIHIRIQIGPKILDPDLYSNSMWLDPQQTRCDFLGASDRDFICLRCDLLLYWKLKPVLGRGQNRYEKPRVRITSGGQLPSASNQSVNYQYSMLTPNAAGHQKLPLVADKVFLKSSLHFLRGYRYFFNISSN